MIIDWRGRSVPALALGITFLQVTTSTTASITAIAGCLDMGEKARMYCVAGLARSCATRSDYHRPVIQITIGGADRSRSILKRTLRITDVIDEQPNTASFITRAQGWIPTKGQVVLIGTPNTNGNLLFAGRILRVEVTPWRRTQRFPRYQCECADYTVDLDQAEIEGRRWTSTSATTIVQNIVTDYLAVKGFAATYVQAGLPAVDFDLTLGEKLSSALTRLAKLVGGYWYVDYEKKIHLYIGNETGVGTLPSDLDASNRNFWQPRSSSDITQIRNRVFVVGGGANTTAAVSAGGGTVTLESTVWFALTENGGTVGRAKAGPQVFTFTGVTATQLTGCSGISYNIAQGEQVRCVVRRDNTSAQTALAAIMGAGYDGIVSHTVEDDALTATTAVFMAEGELALFAESEDALSYITRDKFTKSGRTITADITSPVTIAGDFVIQNVEIDEFEITPGNLFAKLPRRTVTAGRNKRDLFDLLRRLRG